MIEGHELSDVRRLRNVANAFREKSNIRHDIAVGRGVRLTSLATLRIALLQGSSEIPLILGNVAKIPVASSLCIHLYDSELEFPFACLGGSIMGFDLRAFDCTLRVMYVV